jgi:hypothetical protein
MKLLLSKQQMNLPWWGILLIAFSQLQAATIEITPISERNFGQVLIGSSAADNPTNIKNIGDTPLKFDVIDIYGQVFTTIDANGNITTGHSSPESFAIKDNLCLDRQLATQESCTLQLLFAPTSQGQKQASLRINSNDLNTPSYLLPLTGVGVASANPLPMTIEPIAHNFGTVTVNDWNSMDFVLTNISQTAFTLHKLQLDGDHFVISQDRCSNRTISTGQTCKLQISFSPIAAGEHSGVLRITSAIMSETLLVNLQGVGFQPQPIVSTAMAKDFGAVYVNNSDIQEISVTNLGLGVLALEAMQLDSEEFKLVGDYCSNQTLSQNEVCVLLVEFKPLQEGLREVNLSFASNDPNTPNSSIKLSGSGKTWCSADAEHNVHIYPRSTDFGTILVNDNLVMRQGFYSQATGCEAYNISSVTISGAYSNDFILSEQNCHSGRWDNNSYAYCQLVLQFKPQSAGNKSAEIIVKLNDDQISYNIPLSGQAVSEAQASLSLTPLEYNFGETSIGSYLYSPEPVFQLSNTGNVNVMLGWNPAISGDNFWLWYHCQASSYTDKGWLLKPNNTCQIYGGFNPIQLGEHKAMVTAGDSVTYVQANITGMGAAVADCSDANITIESTSNGVWANSGPNGSGHDYTNHYNQASAAWVRRKNLDLPAYPHAGDIVRINPGHIITAIPMASVRTLCIATGGSLESADGEQYPQLYIHASDMIENKGIIKGKNGKAEIQPGLCDAKHSWQVIGKSGCAQAGASVNLHANALIRNEGTIIAGHGGDGSRYAAPGGTIGLWALDIINTNDIGFINAGRGGNITGSQAGVAGNGGTVWIWGNNSLTSDGRGVLAGNGGNCQPNASAVQYGGHGGHANLNAANMVNLLDGTFATGRGGKNCQPLGQNGNDGGFNTDPSVLNLSGLGTKIEGGDISIYGGNDWIINLTNLSAGALTASGNIILATGEGGAINFTGSQAGVVQAGGDVLIYSNDILLDPNTKLSELITAQNIIVAPAKILLDVTLLAAQKISALRASTVPIAVRLANGSPVSDTYNIFATDSNGWRISGVQPTMTVDALSSVEIPVMLAVPAAVGSINTVTITAISQSDMTVSASIKTQIEVVDELPTIQPTQLVPSATTAISSRPFSCNPGTVQDYACSAGGKLLEMEKISANGVISNAIIGNEVTNEGWLMNIQLTTDGVIIGGKLSGYIENAGLIRDVEFKGRSLRGGVLAGLIRNNSEIGGIIQDVQFAPDSSLEGGIIGGEIKGDPVSPLRLDKVVVQIGSYLEHVILGSEVKLPYDVNLGPGVRFDTDFPCKGNGLSLKHEFEPRACFERWSDSSRITVADKHRGKPGELIFAAADSDLQAYSFDGTEWVSIPTDIAEILSATTWEKLPFTIDVAWPDMSQFAVVYIGYRLADGEIVFQKLK